MGEGLDGIAFVERDNVGAAQEEYNAGLRMGFPVFVGVEIVTDTGIVLAFPPDCNSRFFVNQEWGGLSAWEQGQRRGSDDGDGGGGMGGMVGGCGCGGGRPEAEALVSKFNKEGGAVIAAHVMPADCQSWKADAASSVNRCIMRVEGVAGVEVIDGEVINKFREHNPLIQLAGNFEMPCTGGSGVLSELSPLGKLATAFRHVVRTQEHLVEELRLGAFYPVIIG